jgi:hypothetical protein
MTEVPLQRVRARVTVTVEGELSGAPTEDIRAALARSIRTNDASEHVQLIDVGDVRLLGGAGDDVPAPVAADSFYDHLSPEALAVSQRVTPVMDFDQLLGDFWPADETADDVIRAVKSWRRDEG